MKSVGIFGDSFSDDDWVTNDYPCWVELLGQDYHIKNYSLSGTSLWYSYKHFKKFNTHDYNIFVVTIPNRLWIPGHDYHMNANKTTWPVINNINVGEVYYNYLYDDSREECFHDLMVADVINTSNTLIIPAFGESIQHFPHLSLCHISEKEQKYFGLEYWSGLNDRRKCHLTEGNNVIVYEKIKKAINENKKFLELEDSDYVDPKHELIKYWKEPHEQ
jgi:hypothetical protein